MTGVSLTTSRINTALEFENQNSCPLCTPFKSKLKCYNTVFHCHNHILAGDYICELETYGEPIDQVNKLDVLGKSLNKIIVHVLYT